MHLKEKKKRDKVIREYYITYIFEVALQRVTVESVTTVAVHFLIYLFVHQLNTTYYFH